MTECLNLIIVRVANCGKETHVEVLHRQLTGERTHKQQPGSVNAIKEQQA
jgi:hypothetical protein